MLTYHPHQLEELKRCVLEATGITSIIPADCKVISARVTESTRNYISPTTIKRIYGFAHSEFNPSMFTIDVLAKYCGFTGWADFVAQQLAEPAAAANNDVTWHTVRQNALRATLYTLKVLKNRSGIPYSHTIKRKFINDHFEVFLQSDHNATAFIAPAGYGKTIALCHWIDEQLDLNFKQEQNDIILFLSGNALVNNFNSGLSFNDWILSMLGYDGKGDVISLLGNERPEGRFFLVIDALDSYLFKMAQFQVLLEEIVSVMALFKEHAWFKVVLTMRAATWINNKHIIINGQSDWFPGFFPAENRPINVPLFDIEELYELCEKVNPKKRYDISMDVVNILSNPLYFQFYYQSHPDDLCLDKIDQVSMYELISSYILNKVYLGAQATEKQLLIQGIVAAFDPANKVYVADKLKIYDLIKTHQVAYNDLISQGYLRELNTSNDQRFENHIEFTNTYFLGHAIAQTLLIKNNYRFDEELVTTINALLGENLHKIFLLKWCVMYAVKNGQYEELRHISKIKLLATERSELLLFMRDLFEKEFEQVPCGIEKQFAGMCPDDLFEYFFGIEFINTDYERALRTLLKFRLNEARQISVYTSLAAVAISKMDINRLEDHISKLRGFSPDDLDEFPVNPLLCLDTIHAYFKYGIIKKDAFRQITRFCFNPPDQPNGIKLSSVNDVNYLLAIYTLSINANPGKTLRFINIIKRVYPAASGHKAYAFLLRLTEVEAHLQLDNAAQALAIYNELLADFNKEKLAYTPFMKALFYLTKIRVMLYNKQIKDILPAIRPLINLADESGYKLIKIQSLVLVLTNPDIFTDQTAYYAKVYYDLIKNLRESGFREKSFINGQELAIARSHANAMINSADQSV